MTASSSLGRMQVDKRQSGKRPKSGFVSRHRRLRWVLIIALFLTAVLIRMYHIDYSAREWYEDRQYFSAWGARCMYYSSLESVPDWKLDVVEAYPERNSEMMVPLPTMEGIAYILYRLAGGEYMWLPRVFSALAWVIGGIFLYLLAKRLMTIEAALLATGFYLFLPAAITGGRSFQAEPLMVAAMIGSIYAVALHHEKPTRRRVLIAAAAAAVAILVRPVCAFMIFGAFAALSLKRQGLRGSIGDRHSWLFAALVVLPTVVLLVYDRFFIGSEGVSYLEQKTLQPELLLQLDFYMRWAEYALEVIASWGVAVGQSLILGLLTLGAAIGGVIVLRKGYARPLVIGLWSGYIACCLVYTYHISNHHYHHLQLIPLVALCLGPIAHQALRLAMDAVDMFGSRWLSRVVVGGILFIFVAFVLLTTAGNMMKVAEEVEEDVVDARTIGELVDHTTDAIVLSPGRGYDLTYEGWFFGRTWLHSDTLKAMGVDGEEQLHSMCLDWQPRYFVITDLADFGKQGNLKELLFQTYPIVGQTQNYLIFDLTEALKP